MTVVMNGVVKTTRTLARLVGEIKPRNNKMVTESNTTPLAGSAKMGQPLSPMEQLG